MRIDNPAQLRQLQVRYAQIEGAAQVAQTARQHADAMLKSYFDLLSTLLGVSLERGQSVTINWETGEVDIEAQTELALDGVAV